MAYPNDAYDVLLDNRGYMLARRQQLNQGGRSWSTEAQGFSTTQQSTEERRYGSAPPTVDAPMVFRSGHVGYGEERQRVEGAYNYALNMDCRFFEQITVGPKVYTLTVSDYTSDVIRFMEFNGKLYAANGRYLTNVTTTNLVSSEDMEDFGVGSRITDLAVFDGSLLVALGLSKMLVSKNASDGWDDQADVVDSANHVCAEFMTVWQDKLYANLSAYEVASMASGSDPLEIDNWSGELTIGSQSADITSLAASHSLVYVGKEDGLHALDASLICPPLTPEMRAYVSADNCTGMIAWHGELWVPHLRGMLAYTDQGDSGFMLRSAGPGRNLSSDNPVRGKITALAGDDNWLYAALYDGTDTYILAGRPYSAGNSGVMIWHPLIYLENTVCRALHISGLWSSPRLFFGINQDIGYVILPENGDNPLQDSRCRYADSGSIYFSAHSWNAPNTTKLWKSIEVQADNLSMLQKITVYYRIDKGAWIEAGDATLSPSTSIGLEPVGVAGKEIEIRLDFDQFRDRIPIIPRAVIVRGVERPTTTDVITALIRCADNLSLRNGGTCPRRGPEILAEIKALAEEDTAITLVDPVGAERTVVVVPPVVERSEYDQQGDLAREFLIEVKMVVVEFDENRLTLAVLFGGASDYALLVPVEVPIMMGGSTIDTTVTITSSATSRPRITIVGPLTNGVITNVTTGKKLDFTGVAIGPLDVITIDMHTTTPTVKDVDGNDYSANLTSDSNLNSFAIIAGANDINVAGDGATSTTRVYLEY